MFGLESGDKKKKAEEFFFDLEKDVKDSKRQQELKALIEKRIQALKAHLHGGQRKEEFDSLGVLLHGYTSLIKVMSRVK